jgi:hypothetical protein
VFPQGSYFRWRYSWLLKPKRQRLLRVFAHRAAGVSPPGSPLLHPHYLPGELRTALKRRKRRSRASIGRAYRTLETLIPDFRAIAVKQTDDNMPLVIEDDSKEALFNIYLSLRKVKANPSNH